MNVDGTFTAPASGSYLFTVSGMAQYKHVFYWLQAGSKKFYIQDYDQFDNYRASTRELVVDLIDGETAYLNMANANYQYYYVDSTHPFVFRGEKIQ